MKIEPRCGSYFTECLRERRSRGRTRPKVSSCDRRAMKRWFAEHKVALFEFKETFVFISFEQLLPNRCFLKGVLCWLTATVVGTPRTLLGNCFREIGDREKCFSLIFSELWRAFREASANEDFLCRFTSSTINHGCLQRWFFSTWEPQVTFSIARRAPKIRSRQVAKLRFNGRFKTESRCQAARMNLHVSEKFVNIYEWGIQSAREEKWMPIEW